MTQTPKPVTDWAAYIEDVRREAHEQGYAEGRAEGRNEGYQKGIDDASAAAAAAVTGIAEIIKNKVTETTTAVKEPLERVRFRPRLAESVKWTGEETNREKILRALKAKPGMRPVEIIAWLADNGGDPNTNSITTTIKRMRDSDEIEKRGDGWVISGEIESAA